MLLENIYLIHKLKQMRMILLGNAKLLLGLFVHERLKSGVIRRIDKVLHTNIKLK